MSEPERLSVAEAASTSDRVQGVGAGQRRLPAVWFVPAGLALGLLPWSQLMRAMDPEPRWLALAPLLVFLALLVVALLMVASRRRQGKLNGLRRRSGRDFVAAGVVGAVSVAGGSFALMAWPSWGAGVVVTLLVAAIFCVTAAAGERAAARRVVRDGRY